MMTKNDENASPDPSHNLDLVTVYQSANTESNFVAEEIKALLESNGITAFVTGDVRLPNLDFEVRVAQEDLEQAREIIAEAERLGPEAAEEAEAEWEASHPTGGEGGGAAEEKE